jgi:hypothetical protein
MKTYRILGVWAVAAMIATQVFANGPSVLSGKIRTKPITEPPKQTKGSVLGDRFRERTTTNGTKPQKEAKTGGVFVQRFNAKRVGDVIRIEAMLENSDLVASPPIAYTISTRENEYRDWKAIASKQHKPIGAGKPGLIRLDIPNSTKGMQFRLELSPASQPTAECSLKPDITYVVRYTTSSNWINAKRWRNDLSDGFEASEMARLKFSPLGVQSRIHKKKTPEVEFFGGVYMRLDTTLQVRTTERLEQTFATKAEAEAFRESLRALVPDGGFTIEWVGERY